MTFCKSCKARILWGVTSGGKRMPLDYQATPDGIWWVVEGKIRERPAEATIGHHSHFATCPQANQHRKP